MLAFPKKCLFFPIKSRGGSSSVKYMLKGPISLPIFIENYEADALPLNTF
jgi:hypothetical protein